MGSLVTFVFKFIGASLILFLLLTTTITVVDMVTTTSKIMAISDLVMQEVARNNGLSREADDLFRGMYAEVVGFSESFIDGSIRFNTPQLWTGGLLNYGDLADIDIEVDYDMFAFLIGRSVQHGTGGASNVEMTQIFFPVSTLRWQYSVPCLRYIK